MSSEEQLGPARYPVGIRHFHCQGFCLMQEFSLLLHTHTYTHTHCRRRFRHSSFGCRALVIGFLAIGFVVFFLTWILIYFLIRPRSLPAASNFILIIYYC